MNRSARVLSAARWGLVPSWAEKPEMGLKMINARLETVTERPAYRRAFERYREAGADELVLHGSTPDQLGPLFK